MAKSDWWSSSRREPRKASAYELSTGKSVLILGVIVGCFAILWPKIFYPMVEVALRTNKPRTNENLAMVHPRVRQHLMRDFLHSRSGSTSQPFIGSSTSSRPSIGHNQKVKETGGVLNLLMPFYSIGLFVVFLYTILKFMGKNSNDNDFNQEEQPDEPGVEVNYKPIIKDFQMDPNYRKFVFSEEYDENGKSIKHRPTKSNSFRCKKRNRSDKSQSSFKCSSIVEETIEDFRKDEQINELKKRLKITEEAMERILKHVGSLNQMLEDKGLLSNQISNLTGFKEPDEIYRSEDEMMNTKFDKNIDDGHMTSGDSVYSSENQCKSSTDYDSDSSISTTSSKYELEE